MSLAECEARAIEGPGFRTPAFDEEVAEYDLGDPVLTAIAKEVCLHFSIWPRRFERRHGPSYESFGRSIAYRLAWELTSYSPAELGNLIGGGRDGGQIKTTIDFVSYGAWYEVARERLLPNLACNVEERVGFALLW